MVVLGFFSGIGLTDLGELGNGRDSGCGVLMTIDPPSLLLSDNCADVEGWLFVLASSAWGVTGGS